MMNRYIPILIKLVDPTAFTGNGIAAMVLSARFVKISGYYHIFIRFLIELYKLNRFY
ncbi:MAG: hypothetical protein JW891_12235 [Candidatus Lokiarchaeota archaeon]|nr:hypothetical protein [Candidatus Lokiarchaeota archaeon]